MYPYMVLTETFSMPRNGAESMASVARPGFSIDAKLVIAIKKPRQTSS